jgi:hypothetical protein
MPAIIDPSSAAQIRGRQRRRLLRLGIAAVVRLGSLARGTVLLWSDPWSPHHPDEDILPLEAMALWEGIAPREIGWPASTTRLVLSGIEAAEWTTANGRAAWQQRATPESALQNLTSWIGQRYVNPTPLYQLGRIVSIVTGILQLCATAWALGQWVGPIGVIVGTLIVALAPVIVTHSQYVLADITGLLFATILVGVAANPTPKRIVVMGALAGLGASSKFHFGMWLLTPLLCTWFHHDLDRRTKWWLSLGTIGVAVWMTLTLVPWFLINPLLALKEFVGVVLVKLGHGPRLVRIPSNLRELFGSLGVLEWVGLLVGIAMLVWRRSRRLAPIWIPALIGTLVVSESSTVFDRYVLVVTPGAVVLAAWAWEQWLSSPTGWIRFSALAAIAVCTIATIVGLAAAERRAGEADVDVLARRWIIEHVERGRRVAIHDEDNARLPRSADQLRLCVTYVDSPAAWREKWLVEGIEIGDSAAMPMQAVVLTDERHRAYWCRRELGAQTDPGYWLVTFHNERRFGAVLERDAISEFRAGSQATTGGVDVLVTNRAVEAGRPPAEVLRTARGERVIYTR